MAEATASEARKRPAAAWLAEIDRALQREDAWRKKGRKVVERYRDDRDTQSTALARVNILWSNTEVLKAALYPRTANPDVRRRFADAKKQNKAARIAAEVLERTLSYSIDAYDADSAIEGAIEDYLLPGRGVVWVTYDPEIEYEGASEPPEDDEENEPAHEGEAEPKARITAQKLCPEFVYWEDFCHGHARNWKDVPWVARRHTMRQSEVDAKFPEATKVRGGAAAYSLDTASGAERDGDAFVEIWEIWAKNGRERLYAGRGYEDILQADADPLGLERFFPCSEPLYSISTTDRTTPVPEFLQYQDQANELDTLTTRINRLIEQMRWRGVYDATVDADGSTLKALENADDGTLLPHENFQQVRDKGGMSGVVGFVPIDLLPPIVQQLVAQRAQLVQEIYQVTGISDIIRGATDPRETKGAQQLKAQFGSMRMQKRQGQVQRFIRDTYRIMAEVIAEHFTAQTLAEITGYDLPTTAEKAQLQTRMAMQQAPAAPMMGHNGGPPMGGMGAMGGMPAPVSPMPVGKPPAPDETVKAQMPTWEEVIAILRSDKLRGYKVDVETDATALVDAEAEKQSRLEFMKAAQEMLTGAYQAASAAPSMLPLIKEMFLFGMRTYKPGRSLEDAFETAFDELEKNPPQPQAQQQNGDAGRSQASMAETQRKSQRDAAEMQLAAQTEQREAARDKAEFMLGAAALQQKAQQDQAGNVLEFQRQRADAATQMRDASMPAPGPAVKPPSESINFADLPPEAQAQMLAQVGIHIDPAVLAAHADQQAARERSNRVPPIKQI